MSKLPNNEPYIPNVGSVSTNKLQHIPKSKKLTEFKAVVAIDFGTDGSGLAFAKIPKPNSKNKEIKIIIVEWAGIGQSGKNIKTKTCILIPANTDNTPGKTNDDNLDDIKYNNDNNNDNCVKFGYEALFKYMHQEEEEEEENDDDDDDNNSVSDGNSDGDSDGDSNKSKSPSIDEDDELKKENRPMLFQKFKMKLWEGKSRKEKHDISDTINAEDGRPFDTDFVFTQALIFVRKQIYKSLINHKIISKKNKEWIKKIQWVLTVPAIWNERAKHKMVNWARAANIIDPNIDKHLLIVYEPECASIDVQATFRKQGKYFNIGDCYILLDTGGGTVDIAFHEIMDEGRMEDIHEAAGGPYGSTYVDGHFILLLANIFDDNLIETFSKKHPSKMLRLKTSFIKGKESFWDRVNINFNNQHINDDQGFHPIAFDSFECELTKKWLETKTKQKKDSFFELLSLYLRSFIPNHYEKCFKLLDDKLLISNKVWKELFDFCIKNIIKVLNKNLLEIQNKKPNKFNKIKYLCLVGGFAESKYYEYKIKNEYGNKYKILKPDKPMLSVVRGAVRRGLNQDVISARCVLKTYGIAVDRALSRVKESDYFNRLPDGYIENNTYEQRYTKKKTVKNLFSKFVGKGEQIKIDQTIDKTYSRFSEKDPKLQIAIYDSDDPDPVVVSGTPLAYGIINFPKSYTGKKFPVSFSFGRTMISAVAKLDNIEVPLKFDYKCELKKK